MINWIEQEDGLSCNLSFSDFDEAFSFMQEVAKVAKQINHHPDWTNVYNNVSIRLNTHDENGKVTAKDYQLADAISDVFVKFKSKI